MPNDIQTDDLLAIPARVQRAIEYFIDSRDVDKAAGQAGLTAPQFRTWMRKRAVKELVQKKLDVIDGATAELIAEARLLTAHFLDKQLIDAAKNGSVKGDVRAIELGYERIGMRRDGNFMTSAQSTDQTRPQIYRVLEHTVTRTEQTTQRVIAADQPSRMIEGSPSRLLRAEPSEIMEY